MVRPRISLRLFLLLTLLCAAVMGWFAVTYLEPYRREAALIRRLAAMKAEVIYTDRTPHWLWRLFGEDTSRRVSTLVITYVPEFGDDELAEVAELSELESLNLSHVDVSDANIERLGNLTNLVLLELHVATVTNAPPVERMSKLITLNLSGSPIATLNTSGLDRLEFLSLADTHITDDTIAGLPRLPRLKMLDVSGQPERRMTKISDKGIANLTRRSFPA